LQHWKQSADLNKSSSASQVLAFVEQMQLMYRTIAAVPCWLLYYDSLSMGAFWTSGMHGENRPFQFLLLQTCANPVCL